MNSAITRRILAPRFIVGPRKAENGKMTLIRAILIIAHNGKYLEDLLVRVVSLNTEDKGIISISGDNAINKKETAFWRIRSTFGPDVFENPGAADLVSSFSEIFEKDCVFNMMQKGFIHLGVSVRYLRRHIIRHTENPDDHPRVWNESKNLITEGLEFVFKSLFNSICTITETVFINPELVELARKIVEVVSADEL